MDCMRRAEEQRGGHAEAAEVGRENKQTSAAQNEIYQASNDDASNELPSTQGPSMRIKKLTHNVWTIAQRCKVIEWIIETV